MSCPSVGTCTVGGYYTQSAVDFQPFVMTERNGIWGKKTAIPGMASLNRGGFGQIFAVSCASPGNCGAGGYYTDSNNTSQAFVVTETG